VEDTIPLKFALNTVNTILTNSRSFSPICLELLESLKDISYHWIDNAPPGLFGSLSLDQIVSQVFCHIVI
jgi:hypothetical protein